MATPALLAAAALPLERDSSPGPADGRPGRCRDGRRLRSRKWGVGGGLLAAVVHVVLRKPRRAQRVIRRPCLASWRGARRAGASSVIEPESLLALTASSGEPRPMASIPLAGAPRTLCAC